MIITRPKRKRAVVCPLCKEEIKEGEFISITIDGKGITHRRCETRSKSKES